MVTHHTQLKITLKKIPSWTRSIFSRTGIYIGLFIIYVMLAITILLYITNPDIFERKNI